MQEAHMAIIEHFSQTGVKMSWGIHSENGRVSCLYRQSKNANDPTRCGVGVLIPDDGYDAAFDTGDQLASVHTLAQGSPAFLRATSHLEPDVTLMYLGDVQIGHDEFAAQVALGTLTEAEANKKFLDRMDEIADRHNVHPVPDFARVDEVSTVRELVPA